MKALLVTHGIVLFAMFIVAVTMSVIDFPGLHAAWAVFTISCGIVFLQWVIFYAGEDVSRGDS
jgi:hypothetical protein